ASVSLQKTEENLPFLSPFLGTWASGRNQTVAIRGPVRSGSPFLDNLTTQFLVMVGLDTGMIRSAYISNSHSLRGHDPKTGKECPLINAVNCLRGSVVVVENTVHHELQMTDISFDVDIDDNLSYSTVLHELFVPNKITCSKGRKLARMYSTPGMWSYIDASRSQDSSVTVPAAHPGEPGSKHKAFGSFFIPAGPQPGQSDGKHCIAKGIDPFDCCFTTIMSAAACFYRKKDLSFFPSTLTGNVTLVVGGFTIATKVVQSGVPITYSEDVAELKIGPVHMSCSDFTYD
ncbi:unnamed protein product, partial [Polarella glacialis]